MELNWSAIVWMIALKCAFTFATIRSAPQSSKKVIEVTLYCMRECRGRAEAQAQNKWSGKQVILSSRRTEEELIGCHNCNTTNQSRWSQDLQCHGILCKKKKKFTRTESVLRLNKRQDRVSQLKHIIFICSVCYSVTHTMTQSVKSKLIIRHFLLVTIYWFWSLVVCCKSNITKYTLHKSRSKNAVDSMQKLRLTATHAFVFHYIGAVWRIVSAAVILAM